MPRPSSSSPSGVPLCRGASVTSATAASMPVTASLAELRFAARGSSSSRRFARMSAIPSLFVTRTARGTRALSRISHRSRTARAQPLGGLVVVAGMHVEAGDALGAEHLDVAPVVLEREAQLEAELAQVPH